MQTLKQKRYILEWWEEILGVKITVSKLKISAKPQEFEALGRILIKKHRETLELQALARILSRNTEKPSDLKPWGGF